jgi:hypothetical protein
MPLLHHPFGCKKVPTIAPREMMAITHDLKSLVITGNVIEDLVRRIR